MNSDKIISDSLDIAEFDSTIIDCTPVKENDDFEFARRNMRSIIEKGADALDKMIDVADMSQHPRSYEVVATLIKSLADTNKDLLELAEKKNRIEKGKDVDSNKTINNNLYISTSELLKLVKNK
jgi:dsDNA-binding SOS-regulon protein